MTSISEGLKSSRINPSTRPGIGRCNDVDEASVSQLLNHSGCVMVSEFQGEFHTMARDVYPLILLFHEN
jgi:hypothetical protein